MQQQTWHQSELREKITPKQVVSPILSEAIDYLNLLHQEQQLSSTQIPQRWQQIQQEIRTTDTYWQTIEELTYGAKLAWRNSTRCIGRIFWQSLIVRDLRHLSSAAEIFAAIVEHIQLATNQGSLKSVISIFAPNQPGQPGIRIWNPLLIRYAGYQQADGSILGDPAQIKLTQICQRLGWLAPEIKTPFDILPLIIQMPGQKPELFEIPADIVLEVPISHPDYSWFAELGLKWHALPAVSDLRLEIGGVSYSAAPFNGWYMSTEIASRNFGDVRRYNLLPKIAECLGLNTRSKLALWKDQALLELNKAVLHSFAIHGVSIIDHHTASEQFIRHIAREESQGRIVPANWSWIVPPMSGSATEVFHREYENICFKPNFFTQPNPGNYTQGSGGCPFH
ncbi:MULTISPECIES: nitric oxide synthase oxygenase [unclassified Calothrix]|uniref:nitric oxide synthase oxygenase n=1 Tax=unclassified Calothrix TaxID=2619626 RepID=UPI0018F02609|nr:MULTISPECIES: nitric oxide synthase oxygenase [unclassified Calothrix]